MSLMVLAVSLTELFFPALGMVIATAKKKETHTPGPWAWDSRNGKHYLTSCSPAAPHGIVLGWPCGLEEGSWFTSDAYGRADARLIAAAPELLEALTDLCVAIETGWIPPDDVDEYKAEGAWQKACDAYREYRAYATARAAIAKAEGRS